MRRWMRWAGAASMVLLAALGAEAACAAQDGGEASHSLTVWVVRPVTAADRAVQRAQADLKSISTYRESTTGSFGTGASETGQTAGSYGTSASNVGKNASSVGQTAGSYGTSSSDLPSNVTSQTAGSYGTTAGSIGTNASDYTGAPAKAAEAQQNEYLLRTPKWQKFVAAVRSATVLRSDRATFVEVNGLELRARLAKVAGTAAYPDVLLLPRTDFPEVVIGDQARGATAEQQQALLDDLALVHVGRPFASPVMPASDTDPPRRAPLSRPFGYALGMIRAPHPRPTRALLEWLVDSSEPAYKALNLEPGSPLLPPAKIATEATESLFAGGTLVAWADAQMAQFTLANAVSLLYSPYGRVPADLHVKTELLAAEAGDRLAVVLLDGEVIADRAYGRFFPLVVLRRAPGGPWKVLHLSVDLSDGEAGEAFRLLAACVSAGAKAPAVVTPVSLGSPKDGEQRAAQAGLELWWDDASNARVLVVEYQSEQRGGDNQPHLFVVDDSEAKLQTRVTVPFGMEAGPLRWRVWSVGAGGNVQITSWRHLNLIR